MRFFKKFAGLFGAALLLLPSLGQAYTINGNLDVRGNVVGGIRSIGETNNLTLSLASGILKIQCGNADCSTSNPGWVTLPSNTAGQMVTYKITTSPQFGDATAGDSDFVGTGTCSWGTTAAVAWGNALPVLIGAFHDGTTLVIGMARGPVLTTGASANIGYQDNCPSSASQNNVIAMTSTNVTSSHANKAFFPIGAVRATKNSSDNYTFTALDDGDGIQNFYNFGAREYDMVTGQMGAASGSFFTVASGIAPTYTLVNTYKWKMGLDGIVKTQYVFQNTSGGTAGSGANLCSLAGPYQFLNYSTYKPMMGAAEIFNSGSLDSVAIVEVNSATNGLFDHMYQSTIVNGISRLTGNSQNNVSRLVRGSFQYVAF